MFTYQVFLRENFSYLWKTIQISGWKIVLKWNLSSHLLTSETLMKDQRSQFWQLIENKIFIVYMQKCFCIPIHTLKKCFPPKNSNPVQKRQKATVGKLILAAKSFVTLIIISAKALMKGRERHIRHPNRRSEIWVPAVQQSKLLWIQIFIKTVYFFILRFICWTHSLV